MNKISLAITLFLVISYAAFSQDATEIIKKMDENLRGNSSMQKMTMTIVRPTWKRSISMTSWSQGQDYSMIKITAPAKEAGQVFLKRQKEMWNWVPSIDRMIKIPPSMMMQSWMGSDFTNDDLVRESSIVNDYDHSIAGNETIDGMDCYKILLNPKPDAPVVWGKVIVWVTKADYIELKAEFYDEDGDLVNTMKLSAIKTMSNRKLPTHWEMIPADKNGDETILDLETAQFNVNIPQNFFSQQNMKQVR